MKEIKSKITEILKDRMSEAQPLIQIIQGPRQVGKTTALQQFYDSCGKKVPVHFVSGDAITSSFWIQEQWQIAMDQKQILIIDEIQKIPQWSEEIKKLWDAAKRKKLRPKVILTGSSSLSLQKGLSESLTGRFESISAHHWNYNLSNQLRKMSIDEYLRFGGYPKSYEFMNNTKRWSEYITHSIVETVIGKDILMQTQVKSPALFRQAFYLLCSHPGQVVSYNKLLGQLQDKGNTDLIKSYISLFESAYLIKSIQKYSGNEIRKKTSSPKIILMAPALANFHKNREITEEESGRVFESAVGADLIRANLNPFYWADGNYEVDFVLEYKKHLIAIEVKSGGKKKSNSLDAFVKKYPSAKVIFITKMNFADFSQDPEVFIMDHL